MSLHAPAPTRRKRGVAAVAIVLACGVRAAVAGPIDLLPSLARAACTAPNATCAARSPGAGPIRLPAGTRHDIYLRLGAAPRLRLEVAGGGWAVSVATDDAPEREVHRAGGSEPEHATIDLAPFGDRVVRMAFLGAPEGGTEVRQARLEGGETVTTREDLAEGDLPPRPNVVLYVIDTLRADHLGCYGYSSPTSPRIDAFARSAVRFTHALAQSSWTLPSIATILTGRYPPAHGAVDPQTAIRSDVPTLPALLREQGYDTAGFVTNYLGSGAFGLDRGFATYRFYAERGDQRRSVYLGSDALVRRVARWLARGPREPFFLYVHASDPHFPYVPPPRHARAFVSPADAARLPALIAAARPLHNGREEWGMRPARVAPGDLAALRDAYDGDVRMADEHFGRLLDALASRGLAERTLVLLTSDHGEEFLEHRGVAHGQTLYAESLHVPLLVRLPAGRAGGRVIDGLVQHVDIAPTVLAAAGVGARADLPGSSLLHRGAAPAEAHVSLRLGRFALDGLVADRWKVIRDLSLPLEEAFEVYATQRDPGERIDLGARMPVLTSYTRVRLEELTAPHAPGDAVPEARLERLRALGYVTE